MKATIGYMNHKLRNRNSVISHGTLKIKNQMESPFLHGHATRQLLLIAAGLIAFGFGAWGTFIHLGFGGKPVSVLDTLYRTIQLFSLDLYDSGPYPLQLEIGRWLAPLVSVTAIISTFSGQLYGIWLEFKLHRMADHRVMIGNNWPDSKIKKNHSPGIFAQLGERTLPTETRWGNIHVQAPSYREIISKCSMGRAKQVLIKAGSVEEAFTWMAELQYALSIPNVKPLELTFLLNFPEEISTLTELARLSKPNLQIRVVSSSDLAMIRCAELVAQSIAGVIPESKSLCHMRLTLAGDGPSCTHVFRKLAQLIVPVPDLLVEIEILEIAPDDLVRAECNSIANTACSLRCEVLDFDIENLKSLTYSANDLMIFCTSNSSDFMKFISPLMSLSAANPMLKVALLIPEFEESMSVIRMLLESQGNESISFIDASGGQDLIEMVNPSSASEMLAEKIHASYLNSVWEPDAPAGKAWLDLPARYRDSTRMQVQTIEFKLACIGFTIANAIAAPKRLRDIVTTKIETLSEAEHNRWMTEKRLLGWTFGSQRNEATKKHPCLVPYAQLAEADKEKDRVMWREILDHIETMSSKSVQM